MIGFKAAYPSLGVPVTFILIGTVLDFNLSKVILVHKFSSFTILMLPGLFFTLTGILFSPFF